MTPEEINVKIAECCGWTVEPSGAKGGWLLHLNGIPQAHSWWWNAERNPTLADKLDSLPNYYEDLNAMHEAEMMLSGNREFTYQRELIGVVNNATVKPMTLEFALITATAPQRAEAFLRMKGLWKE